MDIRGRVHNGVVVLDAGTALPEGVRVRVVVEPSKPKIVTTPGELPIVQGGEPGSIPLTNERIAEILEEEDLAALKASWNVPP